MIEISHKVEGGASITVKIVEDSITDGGDRLITYCAEYPRKVHAEVMTHREFSRNAASSRAIPTAKLRQRVLDAPAVPVSWGQNQAGMQAGAEIADTEAAKEWWLRGRDLMAAHHAEGEKLGLHKQIVNRVIEPWMTIALIISTTKHANFFHLRDHPAAEPNIQVLAKLMWEAFNNHLPTYRAPGEWHLPYVDASDRSAVVVNHADLKKISTARCARVSYLTHEGVRDINKDIELHDKLVGQKPEDPMHASPLEHPAMAMGDGQGYGNFTGWKQYRKFFPQEAGPIFSKQTECCGLWVPNKMDMLHTFACVKRIIENAR